MRMRCTKCAATSSEFATLLQAHNGTQVFRDVLKYCSALAQDKASSLWPKPFFVTCARSRAGAWARVLPSRKCVRRQHVPCNVVLLVRAASSVFSVRSSSCHNFFCCTSSWSPGHPQELAERVSAISVAKAVFDRSAGQSLLGAAGSPRQRYCRSLTPWLALATAANRDYSLGDEATMHGATKTKEADCFGWFCLARRLARLLSCGKSGFCRFCPLRRSQAWRFYSGTGNWQSFDMAFSSILGP